MAGKAGRKYSTRGTSKTPRKIVTLGVKMQILWMLRAVNAPGISGKKQMATIAY